MLGSGTSRRSEGSRPAGTPFVGPFICLLSRVPISQPSNAVRPSVVLTRADEEIGSRDGMAVFATSEDFSTLNVGFALDEGAFSPSRHAEIAHA